MAITASEAEIQSVAQALSNASGSYKSSLSKLTNLIQEITVGDIKGPLADDLKEKFEAKKNTFENLKKIIDDAEEYMNKEKTSLTNMISDVMQGMK